MKLTYHHCLFSCLAELIDEEFKNMEYDLRFLALPNLYMKFEQSTFNDPDKSEHDCIVEYLTNRETLKKAIKSHDFSYDYSDDHSAYKRGQSSKANIMKLSTMFYDLDFKELWNEYAPETFKYKL